jgi:outer membrane lipoprotein-sorting protein
MRWLAPVGVACVAGLAATGMFKAGSSSESLPHTTPAALIAAVRTNNVTGFSGTVVSQISLGLPDLPSIDNGGDATSFTSLLSGSHTMQIWYGGPGKQRVALLGSTDETDVFRDGRDVWQWSSADRVAVHTVLPARAAASPTEIPSSVASSLTPNAVASRALAALNPSTKVAIEDDRTVADRSAYELILTPRSDATRVGSVRISVDGKTKVPLGVQVFARGSSSPAVDVAFTSIHFAAQADRNFLFTPPKSATVRENKPSPGSSAGAPARTAGGHEVRTTGSDWTTVVALDPGKAALAKRTPKPLFDAMTPVSGTWGSGRLLDTALLSVLITDDGRIYAGAVDPSVLYTAAGTR